MGEASGVELVGLVDAGFLLVDWQSRVNSLRLI